ncbi:MAG: protein kinase [Pleurocapsa minor GSE-CHR-MK-17-07R]|jgi:serine/threonine protein kinase/ABC-type sugar transport system substrate-binding protein|nr:protein kinase [Pleurocapsa minor GSE-CHR-MK 17-07R]
MFDINLTGQRIGDFELIERIGRGGMAVVYRARQVSMRRILAIKIVDLDVSNENHDEFSHRFEREASIIAGLEHLHIVPIYGYGMIDHRYAYMAMRLVTGGTLADEIDKQPFSVSGATELFLPVARALGHAHMHGVIHRDIKPANVLLDEDKNPILSDFGLATFVQYGTKITQSDMLVGTPSYVSPELVQGKTATTRSDVYSMGVLLYHMLAGRPPFEITGNNVMSMLNAHVNHQPPPLADFNPQVPPELESVVLRALAKDPEARYVTAEQMANELQEVLGISSETSAVPGLRHGVQSDDIVARLLDHSKQQSTPVKPPETGGLTVRHVLYGLAAVLVWLLVTLLILFTRPPLVVEGEIGTSQNMSLAPFDVLRARVRQQLGGGYIAVLLCSGRSEIQRSIHEDLEGLSERDGLDLRVLDGEGDEDRQVTLLQQAIEDGASAFIICALDTVKLTPLLDRIIARNQAVTFMSVTDYEDGAQLDAQNYAIGYQIGLSAALYMNRTLGGTGGVLGVYPQAYAGGVLRIQGARDALAEYAPTVRWLGEVDALTQETASSSIQSYVQQASNPPQVLLSSMDTLAYGLVEGLEASGVGPEQTSIFSVNAEASIIPYIEAGRFVRGSLSLDHSEGARLLYISTIQQMAGAPTPQYVQYGPNILVTQETLRAGTLPPS